jgi:hypothetical protein
MHITRVGIRRVLLWCVVYPLLFILLFLLVAFPWSFYRSLLLTRRYRSITVGMTEEAVTQRLGKPTGVLAADLEAQRYKGMFLKPGTHIPKGAFLYIDPAKRAYCYVLFDSSGKVIETQVHSID